MKLTRLWVGAAALLALTVVAHAEGMFAKLPIVGGAAYCALFAGDGTTCAANVPAGPTALTGAERIPADTRITGGQSPQTVLISPAVLNAGPTQYSVPVTTNSITIAAATRQVIVNPAGTIAALTLVFPPAAALVEGQRIGFCSTQVITTLTTTAGTGLTLSSAPTAMVASGAAGSINGSAICVEWVYVASQTTLFRTQ
jgi:hypothetical protein